MGRLRVIKNIRKAPSFVNKPRAFKNNNITENNKVMDTQEKIAMASSILEAESGVKAKRIKKDKGLLERTESSTIILTEDNKELLKD